MTGTQGGTSADLYLRLSDFRADDIDSFTSRETRLRAEAARLGWLVNRVVVENDLAADGRRKPASAYKRQLVRRADGTPKTDDYGRRVYRVLRPGWQSVLADLGSGAARAVLAEDLDRAARDPRDIEDLIDAVSACRGHARSLSGSLRLTDGGRSDELAMARVLTAMGAKSSADTARRVADGRQRSAEAGSYAGGRRPFGFRPDPDAPKGRRTLVIVPAEAEIIRRAAAAVLAETAGDRKSLAHMARELREAGTPTVTGAAWTPATLKDILCKPAVAGIAVNTRTGTETAGAWPAILDREVWEAVRAVLTDPARRTNTSNANAPRYLLSGIARCHCGGQVKVNGGKRSPAYVCADHAHLRRNAAGADKWVAAHITAYLNREDNRDLLRPAARPGVDTGALRAESARLDASRKAKIRMNVAGDLDDADLAEALKEIRRRMGDIAAQLAATTAPDPLAEFRDQPDAAAVWDKLPLPRKLAVARLLVAVTLLPATRRGAGFDPDSVRVEPNRGGAAS